VVQWVHQEFPESPLIPIGFSLSANIIIKMLGENSDLQALGVDAAVVVSPPMDLEKSAHKIVNLSWGIFDRYFLLRMRGHVRRIEKAFPEEAPTRFSWRMNMRDFDDHYTAPRSGFDSATHYYRTMSGKNYVQQIAVPTLLMHAADDPVVDGSPLESLALPDAIDLVHTERGGHVGFLARDGFWMDAVIERWIAARPGFTR